MRVHDPKLGAILTSGAMLREAKAQLTGCLSIAGPEDAV
jgi:hypothetical protein